jgi:hypothetical protein
MVVKLVPQAFADKQGSPSATRRASQNSIAVDRQCSSASYPFSPFLTLSSRRSRELTTPHQKETHASAATLRRRTDELEKTNPHGLIELILRLAKQGRTPRRRGHDSGRRTQRGASSQPRELHRCGPPAESTAARKAWPSFQPSRTSSGEKPGNASGNSDAHWALGRSTCGMYSGAKRISKLFFLQRHRLRARG